MELGTKVQAEAIKALEKGEKESIRYAESQDGKWVYITVNGFYAVRIAGDCFWLDKEKIRSMPTLSKNFLYEKVSNAQELKTLGEMKRLDRSRTVDIFQGSSFDVCVDSKHLKLLSKDGCKLYAKDEKSPIYFVLKGEIYAVVMPVSKKNK